MRSGTDTTLQTTPGLSTAGDGNLGSVIAVGAAAAAAYALLYVLVNGVVLDETVVPAQIITGTVSYPPGHPHDVYYRHTYSLFNYLGAAVWSVAPNALALSAIRNWLYVFVSILSVYVPTVVLTRRSLWGFVAVWLVILQTQVRFQSVYPMHTFPVYYSSGHIGLHTAILAVALVLAGMPRTGGFLVGLLPSVHLTLAIPAFAASVYHILRNRRAPDGRTVRTLSVAITAGLAVSALVAVIPLWLGGDRAAVAPYIVHGDSAFIREQFRLMTDFHRRGLHVASFGYLMNPVAFVCIGALLLSLLRERNKGTLAALWAIFIMATVAWAFVVVGIMASLGVRLPEHVHAVMPMRFSNYTAALALPLTAAALQHTTASLTRARAVTASAIFALFVIAVTGLRANPTLLPGGEIIGGYAIFFVWGMLVAFASASPGRLRLSTVCGTLMAVALVLIKPDVILLVGVVGAAVATGLAVRLVALVCERRPRLTALMQSGGVAALVAGLAIALVVELPFSQQRRMSHGFLRFDILSNDDVRMRTWLSENASPDDLILSAILPRALIQAKTGHPVLLETETLWLMTYMPSIAPVVAAMTSDLYGVDYTNPAQLRTLCPNGQVGVYVCPVWYKIWRRRTHDEWRSLADKYRFHFVVCGSDVTLQLRLGYSGERLSVYVID
jgi:hypothetical protein